MNLGNTIQQFREKKGVKQFELATNLGITATYLSQIEHNKKKPTISLLEKICEQLSLPMPFMFFLSIDEKDIPVERLAHFRLLEPMLKKFISELIEGDDKITVTS